MTICGWLRYTSSRMKPHFLQSEAWERFQHALGHETIRREGDGWAYLAIVEHGGGLTRLYCPYGPTVATPEALNAALVSLKEEAKKCKADFARLQPYSLLLTEAAVRKWQMFPVEYSQPEATRVIDLTPPLEEIIGQMSQSKRSVVRNYRNKGLKYRESHDPADVEQLIPLLHDIAARNHITVHDDGYLRLQAKTLMPGHASLHFMDLNDKPITGALLFEDDETVYYAHAGTAAEHYKLQANTALVGELIAYAKKQEKKRFDLFGIAPNDDPNHRLAGVTGFKASFGGAVVQYNQTYDLPYRAARYKAYQMLRSLKRKLKRH